MKGAAAIYRWVYYIFINISCNTTGTLYAFTVLLAAEELKEGLTEQINCIFYTYVLQDTTGCNRLHKVEIAASMLTHALIILT